MDKLHPPTAVNFKKMMLASIIIGVLLFCSQTARTAPAGTSSDSAAREELLRACDYNLNHFLLDEVMRHRLVLLADGRHGSSVYLQGVISFLNAWIDSLESSPYNANTLPTKLFLILEADPNEIAGLRGYFADGDLSKMILPGNLCAPQFTTASLEFYYDLREIFKRIGAANAKSGGKPMIMLDLFGPEKVIDISNWSIAKRDSFFIFERDQYSSKQVFDLLTRNPSWKALAFYGGDHVTRSKVMNSAGHTNTEKWYLAHYLDSLFDSTGALFTVQQFTGNRGRMAFLSGAPDSSYALEVRQLTDPTLGNFNQTGADADGLIVRYGDEPKERSVFDVRSQTIVNLIRDSSGNWHDFGNDFYRAQVVASIKYLTMIYGATIDTMLQQNHTSIAQVWKPWIDSISRTRLDVVKDMENQAPVERLLDHLVNSYGKWTNFYEWYIAHAIGRTRILDTTKSSGERAQAYRDILKKERTSILVDNLVNLLWVGTGNERADAQALLAKITGKTYATPKQWMIWYRNDFLPALVDLYRSP